MDTVSIEDHYNDTDDEYIYEYDLDESYATFNWSELGPSLFVFGVTFIVGILGNTLILVAVLRHTHVKSSPVNVFLASLASADLLLILVCLPLKVSTSLAKKRRILCVLPSLFLRWPNFSHIRGQWAL